MLYDQYITLCKTVPQDKTVLLGLPLENEPSLWISIDHNGHPSLLLPAQENDPRPDIVLRSIDVSFSRLCEIQTTDGSDHSGCFSIVKLKESDRDIVRLFSKILEERFCRAAKPKNNSEIAGNIQELAALFSRVDGSTKDLIGLWGELNLILCAENLLAAVRSWSTRKTAKYDFVAGSYVLDVKTTLSVTPKHRFSLEQLRPNGDYDAYILSTCLVEVPSGQTVGSLMDIIGTRIEDSEIRSAFLNQCITKGGADIYRSAMKLQTYPDQGTLNLYRASDIPVPTIGPTEPISNVRFDVDLTSISPLDSNTSSIILRFCN